MILKKILVGLVLSLGLVGCSNTTESKSYEYTHSNVYHELEGKIDSDLIEYFDNKGIEIYREFAGKEGKWEEYTVSTPEEKIKLLNSQGIGRLAMYSLNNRSLTENEETYLEELLECTFSRLVHSEGGAEAYCNEHNPKI